MTHVFAYTPSEKTTQEIKEFEKLKDDLVEMIKSSKEVDDFFGSFFSLVHGKEFIEKTKFNEKLKILDIGFGRGESSLYLASQGHEVHAVEPSPDMCEVLQRAAEKYGLTIQIYQGVAEHLDQIQEQEFDVCIFNSSFHHCDDPIKALELCKRKLKKGGVIKLINEPLLKFYRSKAWYFRMLEEDPVSMGHYGGNEHIYYFQEYVGMLKKAGFSSIKYEDHVKHAYPRESIRDDFAKQIDGEYVLSNKKLCLKFFILLMFESLSKSRGPARLLFSLFTRLSLLPVSFTAKNIS